MPYEQLPKPLISLPISNDAKLLFTLLNDRFQLSLKNDFKDEDGYVFCYFSNREICEKLRCAHGKATKLLRELEDAGLIYREKSPGKADRFYVGGVQEEDEPCRSPAEDPADSECAAMPKIGTGVCRFSAPSKNKENNKEFITSSEESKERLAALLERLDFNSLWTEERASGLRQLRWHIATVMETEFPFRYTDEQGRVFSGSMDLVWVTGKGCVLVDYKTFSGKRSDLFCKDGKHWAGNYASQLHVYGRALGCTELDAPMDKLLFYPVEGLVLRVG